MRGNCKACTEAAARRPVASVTLISALLVIGGCSGDRMAGFELPSFGGGGSLITVPKPPPVSINGRWILASPGRGQCNMTFGAAGPNATEGTIAPEGGCPGQFYTSRKWTHDSSGLTIRNHNSEPLAQLSDADGRFAGQTPGGEAVTLTR